MFGTRNAVIRTFVAGVVMVTSLHPMAAAPAWAGERIRYQAIDLGFVGRSIAINDKRQVVGEYIVGSGFDIRRHAFLWENGRFVDLGLLAHGTFEHAEANDINNRGQIVGQSAVAPGVQHAFLWEDGVMTDLGPSGVRDINDRGQIAGGRWFGDIPNAVLLEDGQVTRLDLRPSSAWGINNSGTVVGYLTYAETETTDAYLWRAGKAYFIGGQDDGGWAVDINDRGEVLVSTDTGLRLWRNGVLTRLDRAGVTALAAFASKINNRGDIVASDYEVWHDEHAMVYLRQR